MGKLPSQLKSDYFRIETLFYAPICFLGAKLKSDYFRIETHKQFLFIFLILSLKSDYFRIETDTGYTCGPSSLEVKIRLF